MTTPAGHPEPGESIGPYRVVRRLGSGGMGTVFEALDTQLNRPVALKVISPHLAHDPTFRARFTREAQAQASLDSPHVVHVYAHGEVEGRLYIATQLVPDGDLGQMIDRNGAAPVPTALEIIAQVASGLADAHAVGLVHRDIKPGNVLLRIEGQQVRAYLADFGIARQVHRDQTITEAGSMVGTPAYMAPELHTGVRAGVQSDVYSLGCLLWATLSGEAPYRGTSDYETVSLHIHQPIPQLPETSPLAAAVNRVLRRALAKRPEERYASAAQLRDDLRAAALLPRAAGTAGPRRGRVGLVLAAVAVAVLALAGTGLALVLSGDDEPSATAPTSAPTQGAATADEPSPAGTDEPTGAAAPSEPPTEPPVQPSTEPSYTPRNGDEDKAIANLVEGLHGQGIPDSDAACVAGAIVKELGIERMVEAGMLTEDLEVSQADQAGLPSDVQGAVVQAALSCALS